MNKNLIIRKTENFVKKLLSKEGTGHDFWHIERVINNAKLINKKEKGDFFVINLALLLHDIGDRKVIGKIEDDYSLAEDFLKKQKIERLIIEKIMFIIKNMSFSKSFNRQKISKTKEFCVVQDADRLDSIGAIGIARAFTYGGSKKRPIYDPIQKVQNIKTTKEYIKLKSSTFHHFKEKLLLLKDLMNTKTAKKISESRNDYMKKYLKKFLNEWEGKE